MLPEAFGDMFIEHVLPNTKPQSKCSTKATIATNKDLGTHFEYLRDYGRELLSVDT
jgi:hypothetical protein